MHAHIVIADEHILIRRGLMSMINQLPPVVGDIFARPAFIMRGDVATPAQLMALLAANPVDILFLGFSLANLDSAKPGVSLLRWINQHYPALKVVVISPYKNSLLIRLALEAGAMAYIGRDSCEKTLQNTLRSILNNKVFVQRGLMNSLLLRESGSLTGQPLSPRETDVLRHLYQDLSQPVISSRLKLSNKTVSAHKMHAMEKLDVKSDCQLYCLMALSQMF